ncbi:hypothetical protein [Streptosporangium sp. NPDC002524]|uniref:hypothetical protein n=1 Tax=Streptosporangium sp. NPDC002524 TaxID=3154537 RepID=UPI0033293FCD
MANSFEVDLEQLERDVAQLLTAAGFPRMALEKTSGFDLMRHLGAIRVRWAVDPTFDAMTLDLDPDHPMTRFELDVVNATLSAFVEILVKAGYTVTTRLPDHLGVPVANSENPTDMDLTCG